MWYAIMGRDAAGSLEQRRATRPRHLAYVGELVEAGRLLVAGPHPAIDSEDPGEAGFSGSLVIAEFASQEEAELWARHDPYWLEGVFDAVEVKPFKRVLP